MNPKPRRRHALPLVPCLLAVLLLGAIGASRAETRTRLIDFEEMAKLDAQVRAATLIVSQPKQMELDGVGVLWITARQLKTDGATADGVKHSLMRMFRDETSGWKTSQITALKHWVARGHVLWVDTGQAVLFGLTDSVGGSTNVAVVAEQARNHPLVRDVTQVECMDVFRYMRGVPTDATPILTVSNRPDHVVMASWLLGKGLILFRPQGKFETVNWTSSGQRDWIEPDVADARQLLHNINCYTMDVLRRNRLWPPKTASWEPRPLSAAFGVATPQ